MGEINREEQHKAPAASGLDGINVADTRLSDVDGEGGRLILAGRDVESLALKASFEDVCALLWGAALREDLDADAVRSALAEGRRRAFDRLGSIGDALSAEDGMDALRAAASHLGFGSSRAMSAEGANPTKSSSNSTVVGELAAVTGAVAVFAAAWARSREGLEPLAPDESLGHAADFLRMIRGERAPSALSAALDAYLVTVSDHGMNASTFAARVVTSTGSDRVSAVVAAIGALKGPLHGGAPGPVLDMLDAIGSPDRAEAWIEAELAAGRRIMGMGHRIYRVRDPRAAVLEQATLRLEQAGFMTGRLALARAVERAAEGILKKRYPDRPLRANVEFYTAVLLDSVGLSRRLFSPAFAAGRVAGWCAHIEEQRAVGRLIRPASRFVGPVLS
ncbi:MAG: citrate synthase [Polyangiaceae bacterium]|nr:citrate synthase [Polyangiaceae bacterium]